MSAAQIVLIDDDRSWLEALAEYLQRSGFSVLAATDPAEGLALLRKHHISLVICDYDMPGMTGLDVMRSIRRQPGNVPVLLVSGGEEAKLANLAVAGGARGFLPKTAPPAHLVRKLRQILADVDAVGASHSTLQLWQRLLPSPQRVKRIRNMNRPAARSCRVLSTSGPRQQR